MLFILAYLQCFLLSLVRSHLLAPNPLFVQKYNSVSIESNQCNDIVVFIHGILDSSNTFIKLSDEINRSLGSCDNRVALLGIDTPGHGNSCKLSSLDYNSCAVKIYETIRYIQQEFQTNNKVHLVGHSTGGKLCAVTALQFPEVVASLIFLDVMPLPFLESHWSRIRSSLHMINNIPMKHLNNVAQVQDYLSVIRMPTKLRILLGNSCIEVRAPDSTFTELDWCFDITRIIKSIEYIQNFPDKKTLTNHIFHGHVLVIRGDPMKSSYVQDEAMAEMRQMFPLTQQVVISGAGHWLHAEAVEITARKVVDFLQLVINDGNSHM